MNILLIPIGSAGDVHPFVGIGVGLAARGHQTTIVTSGYFETLVRRAGLDFEPLGTAEDYIRGVNHPDLWHPRRGLPVIAALNRPLIRQVFDIVQRRYRRGETIVVASSMAFGARIAQDHLQLPLASVHLQPSLFRSYIEPPIFPVDIVRAGAPRLWKDFVYWLMDYVFDRLYAAEINALRKELGLPPLRRLMADWCHSPQRVIGLFPDWFAAQQPDWPAQTRLTGFPLYDERGIEELPPDAERFLDDGDAPIVFTPGSAMTRGQDFFAAAREACDILGRRGIFLTRFGEQVPARLPDRIKHFDFIPLSQLLPRCAGLVHHGGIGTCAQALAAGTPQLVMPMSYDQPDNAARLERLGVAGRIKPRHFRGPRVAQALAPLLGSAGVQAKCKEVAQRFDRAAVLNETCRLIEDLAAPEKVAV